jgi:hypothetical protein
MEEKLTAEEWKQLLLVTIREEWPSVEVWGADARWFAWRPAERGLRDRVQHAVAELKAEEMEPI